MADKEEFSLKPCTGTNSRAGGSGASMAPDGFSEAFLGEQTGAKRKGRKRRAGRKGSATKTKGEETADQTAMTKMAALAEKATMPVAAGETAEKQEQEEDFDKIIEKAKAEYAQLMDKLFGGGQPKVKWVRYPSYMSYPGMEADMEADGLNFDEEVER
ncbi:hypothetical protein ACQJBY_017476 [Aegilops geniculata]